MRKSFPEPVATYNLLLEKDADCSHMETRTHGDFWAQLNEGTPPGKKKKKCGYKPKLNNSKKHILQIGWEAQSQMRKAQTKEVVSAKHRDFVLPVFFCTQP